MAIAAAGRTRLVFAATFLALLFALILTAMALTGGMLVYTMDDPYIHLAVGEEILRGGYGINIGVPASPSSSVIYPYLMAGLLALGVGDASPLLVTATAALVTLMLVAALFRQLDLPLDDLPVGALIAIALAMVLCLNLIGLVFAGLEHSLQIMAAVAALLGLVRYLRRGWPEAWWLACLAAQPLIRFEGGAITTAALLVLAIHRRWTNLLVVVGATAAVFVPYFLRIQDLGLPLLPSSVLAKAPSTSPFDAVVQLFINVGTRSGLLLFAMLVVLLFIVHRRSADLILRKNEEFIGSIALFCSSVVLAHLLFGAIGTVFRRYEVYAVWLGVLGLVAVFRAPLRKALDRASSRVAFAALGTAMGLFLPYVLSTLGAPLASAGIYGQQYQMHRFVTEFYRAPVAVNDLGWVSYRNDVFVLDLWGLGSEEARQERMRGEKDPAWMDRLARRHGVDLAMIFDEWFPQRPANWTLIGHLVLPPRPTSYIDKVGFYATRAEAVPLIAERIEAFRGTLPAGVRFTYSEH